MARINLMARSAWDRAQTLAVVVLCAGATMVLPLTLASLGFQSL